MWLSVGDAETFARAKACIDEAVARDARVVSARVTDGLSGHDGEWFSVRAGALGRALVLDLSDTAAVLSDEIDAELDREQRIFAEALERGAPATTTLALATTIAHNLGDLSRVVDAWPKAARASELCARYSRLGHADAVGQRAEFLVAGALNKELMALENHRLLALRSPARCAAAGALLLPVGPWFDAWRDRVPQRAARRGGPRRGRRSSRRATSGLRRRKALARPGRFPPRDARGPGLVRHRAAGAASQRDRPWPHPRGHRRAARTLRSAHRGALPRVARAFHGQRVGAVAGECQRPRSKSLLHLLHARHPWRAKKRAGFEAGPIVASRDDARA